MKIGIYTIPDLDPEKAIGFAKMVYDFPAHKISKAGFAEKSKINLKGGWFGQVIRAMRDFGLVEEIVNDLQTAEMMDKLLYPKPGTTELQEAKEKVFNSVPLWKKLFSDGIKKTDAAKADFWVYLSDLEGIKGLDREQVKNKAPLVQKSYISALSYIEAVRGPMSLTASKPLASKQESKAIGFGGREHITTEMGKEQMKIQRGGLYLEIVEDEKALENIEYAKDLLGFMETRLRRKHDIKNKP
jgi:hypothetical protein